MASRKKRTARKKARKERERTRKEKRCDVCNKKEMDAVEVPVVKMTLCSCSSDNLRGLRKIQSRIMCLSVGAVFLIEMAIQSIENMSRCFRDALMASFLLQKKFDASRRDFQ